MIEERGRLVVGIWINLVGIREYICLVCNGNILFLGRRFGFGVGIWFRKGK